MNQISITDVLVADYLQRRGFLDTFKAFESDLNTTLIRSSSLKYENLEDIITDRVKYLDMAYEDIVETRLNTLNLNADGSESLFKKWSYPCVDNNKDITDLIGKVLVIHLSATKFKIHNQIKDVLFVTTNDKKVSLIDLQERKVLYCFTNLNKSIGKCCYGVCNTDTFLSCGMDGVLRYFKISEQEEDEEGIVSVIELSSKQLHKRLITDFKYYELDGQRYIISIGWDSFLKLHKITEDNKVILLSEFKLLSNATTLDLTYYENMPIFLLTRLDSTQLSYFSPHQDFQLHELVKVSLNDAEFSTHGFTPMSIAINSGDITKENGLVAIATSHIPYLRVIITKTPNFKDIFQNLEQESTPTVRGHILRNYTTMSPQDKFSQSKICWRTDQSGVWILGDDGAIRGLELQNGQTVECLQDGHDSKIKNMIVTCVDGQEVIVSAGIDKKLNYWTAGK